MLVLSLNSPRVCWLVLMSSRNGYIAEILRRVSYFFPERDVLISDLNLSKIESIVFDAFKDVDGGGRLIDQVSEWDKAGKLVFSYLSIPLRCVWIKLFSFPLNTNANPLQHLDCVFTCSCLVQLSIVSISFIHLEPSCATLCPLPLT
jgi:hypothetical protein